MKKKKISEFNNETLDRVVAMAQEEKKPFEVLKEEFGVSVIVGVTVGVTVGVCDGVKDMVGVIDGVKDMVGVIELS